jgi:hypothetical protein
MDIDEALLDISWKNTNEMFNRFHNVDTKAFGVITVCGVLASLLAAFANKLEVASVNSNVTTTIAYYKGINSSLFTAAGMFLIFTILACLYVIRPRDIMDISTKRLSRNMESISEEAKNIHDLVLSIGEFEEVWRNEAEKKAREFRNVLYLLAFSVILLIISFLFPIILNY